MEPAQWHLPPPPLPIPPPPLRTTLSIPTPVLFLLFLTLGTLLLKPLASLYGTFPFAIKFSWRPPPKTPPLPAPSLPTRANFPFHHPRQPLPPRAPTKRTNRRSWRLKASPPTPSPLPGKAFKRKASADFVATKVDVWPCGKKSPMTALSAPSFEFTGTSSTRRDSPPSPSPSNTATRKRPTLGPNSWASPPWSTTPKGLALPRTLQAQGLQAKNLADFLHADFVSAREQAEAIDKSLTINFLILRDNGLDHHGGALFYETGYGPSPTAGYDDPASPWNANAAAWATANNAWDYGGGWGPRKLRWLHHTPQDH